MIPTPAPAPVPAAAAVESNQEARIPEDPITPGETVTVRVVVFNASDGVDSYDATARSGHGGRRDRRRRAAGRPGQQHHDRHRGVGTVVASGANRSADVGASVAVVEATLRAVAPGTANLRLSVETLRDGDGRSYTVTRSPEPGLTVSGPPTVVLPDPPTDPDGDGLYEDLDGSDGFTIVDVAAFLGAFDRIADGNGNARFFDFDSDGGESVVDVAALLDGLRAGRSGRAGGSAGRERPEPGDRGRRPIGAGFPVPVGRDLAGWTPDTGHRTEDGRDGKPLRASLGRRPLRHGVTTGRNAVSPRHDRGDTVDRTPGRDGRATSGYRHRYERTPSHDVACRRLMGCGWGWLGPAHSGPGWAGR